MPHLPREHSRATFSKPLGWLALLVTACAGVLPGASDDPPRVTAVRFWSLGDVTRVAIEADGDFQVASDHLSNPERVFFDLNGTKPALGSKAMTVIPVGDKLIQQIRVAEPRRNVTRVVLDLTGVSDTSVSRLENPNRLIIEVRHPVGSAQATEAALEPKPPEHRPFTPPPAIPSSQSKPSKVALVEPPVVETRPSASAALSAKLSTTTNREIAPPPLPIESPAAVVSASLTPPPAPGIPAAVALVSPPEVSPLAKRTPAASASETAVAPLKRSTATNLPDNALPAKRNTTGDRSMVRVLGLKIGRIVLDPGHGGHDTGTVGPEGLREKDLVLDVAKRLGALIEDRMGSEVIYTRSDDTFIPLERRTEIANEAKADLFLSIHANSSPMRSAAGVETYYLSFTTSKTALDLAARENAGSQETVYDLQDLLQKIALKDKVEESRDFAARVQTSLFALSAKNNAHAKDRGIKKAPFVVLIGASMPSVLAEIGFISNAHDESTMKRGEYRERIAEALFKGVSGYASTLSHFQVAQRRSSSSP
jgi:N-acetylmuramoyl-L-alanine amidase